MEEEKKKVLNETISLISDIQQENIGTSEDTALRAISLAESIINDDSWKTAENLMSFIKIQIKYISENLPQEIISMNILRHVLKVIREEHDLNFKIKGEEKSLHNMIRADTKTDGDYTKPLETLRTLLLDHLSEYRLEVETSMENIASQALEHIHSNEIILTIGKSRTVEKFLKTAAARRTFQVIVAEGAPSCDGQKMAESLGKSEIKTTVISDASIFAVMSRVNKVIIGTHSVLADGSLCARCGTYPVGRCAKHYSVPVIVLTHLYKLSPRHSFPYDINSFNATVNPEEVLPLSMGPLLSEVTVYNPMFDHVPFDFVTLYVTHQGGNAPSYLYRLLTELYHPDDYDL